MIPGKLEYLLYEWGPVGGRCMNQGRPGVLVLVYQSGSPESWVQGLNVGALSMLWHGVVVYVVQWIGHYPFHWQCCQG